MSPKGDKIRLGKKVTPVSRRRLNTKITRKGGSDNTNYSNALLFFFLFTTVMGL